MTKKTMEENFFDEYFVFGTGMLRAGNPCRCCIKSKNHNEKSNGSQ